MTVSPSRDPGVYVVWLHLPHTCTISVGALGCITLPSGHYLYVGSAKGGLRGRVERYLKPVARKFWHIDYLRAYANVRAIWLRRGRNLSECLLTERLLALPGFKEGPPGFGSSDCRCRTHLLYSPASPLLRLETGALFDARLQAS